MPEFILPAEADTCPYCGAYLTLPPRCCGEARADYDAEERKREEEINHQLDLMEREEPGA